MPFRDLGRRELEALLREVDRRLDQPATVIVIGGAMAAFFGSPMATSDVDVWSADREFWDACVRLGKETGRQIPVHNAAIAQLPYHFEDRLVQLEIVGLTRLSVAVPELHDWAIAKIARGVEHDFEHVESLHTTHPLVPAILLERFHDTEFIGHQRSFELSFLRLIDRLFGEAEARSMEGQLKKPPA